LTYALDGGSSLHHAPAALTPVKNRGAQWTWGWVGPTEGLDVRKSFCVYRDSYPVPFSPQHVKNLQHTFLQTRKRGQWCVGERQPPQRRRHGNCKYRFLRHSSPFFCRRAKAQHRVLARNKGRTAACLAWRRHCALPRLKVHDSAILQPPAQTLNSRSFSGFMNFLC